MSREEMPTSHALLMLLPRLRRHALALVGDAGVADELVHDTLESFREAPPCAGDLRSELLKFMHRVHREPAVSERPAACAFTPHVDEALQLLSLAQRQVILLAVLEDLPYEQVAMVLDIPVEKVASLLSQGRARLHAIMKGPRSLAIVK
ncbi:MAG: sigma factor-like helix-turn-helix DNA-binding protein [Pseudomonas sp.]|uniref:sigma factor-like helix-turn-helix DNA-binding protein n=1 Tax=Pseudomonas sp. TaxID=306 RepID=UPI003D11374F